jgi:hypothetical protein
VAGLLRHVDHDHPEHDGHHRHVHPRRPADQATVPTPGRFGRRAGHAGQPALDDDYRSADDDAATHDERATDEYAAADDDAPTTTQAGPTPEEQAIAKLNNGADQCYPFPAPIQQGYGQNTITTSGSGPTFVLTVVTHNMDGSTLQTFTWNVDRATLAFTPTNDLAQVASNHCSLLR